MRSGIRLRITFIGLLIIGLAWIGLGDNQADAQGYLLRDISVEQARDLISSRLGRPVVVLFYGAYCPASRNIFEHFVELATQWRSSGISIIALSTDKNRAKLESFLGDASLPFDPLILKPWQEGELGKNMGEVGIPIGKKWSIPMVAVIDSGGQLVMQDVVNRGLDRVEATVAGLR